jgi:hypothetical protein
MHIKNWVLIQDYNSDHHAQVSSRRKTREANAFPVDDVGFESMVRMPFLSYTTYVGRSLKDG